MAAVRFETGLGTCGVRWSERGITAVIMPGDRAIAGCPAGAGAVPAAIATAVESMVALLAGEPRDLREVVLDDGGIDPFRRSVYAAAREIPAGATATYGEIARRIGAPRAAQAVGAALGANPFPIVVPCHRVLAATGALHGFSAPGGIATKRRMLEIEGAPGFAQETLFA